MSEAPVRAAEAIRRDRIQAAVGITTAIVCVVLTFQRPPMHFVVWPAYTVSLAFALAAPIAMVVGGTALDRVRARPFGVLLWVIALPIFGCAGLCAFIDVYPPPEVAVVDGRTWRRVFETSSDAGYGYHVYDCGRTGIVCRYCRWDPMSSFQVSVDGGAIGDDIPPLGPTADGCD